MRKLLSLLMAFTILLVVTPGMAKEKAIPNEKIIVPKSVVNISKFNTYPNPTSDEPELQPSPLAQKLLDTTDIQIKNPTLIRMLNESNIHTSKLSVGYHAKIFLGNWPLTYQSEKTTVNWEYKEVNDNILDNRGGENTKNLSYLQEKQTNVEGGLTAKVPNQQEVKKLMLMEAAEKTELPISFSTMVGRGTKIDRVYHVLPKKIGHLHGYVPAVNEKGKITYGEVYLVLDGNKVYLEVKNVTQQGLGALIPVQDHITLKYIPTN